MTIRRRIVGVAPGPTLVCIHAAVREGGPDIRSQRWSYLRNGGDVIGIRDPLVGFGAMDTFT